MSTSKKQVKVLHSNSLRIQTQYRAYFPELLVFRLRSGLGSGRYVEITIHTLHVLDGSEF